MQKSWSIALVAAAVSATPTHALAQIEREKIERLVAPVIEAEMAPGVSVSVSHGGVVQHFGFGTVTFGGDEEPDERTVYEIGSITKVFTGVLLADAARRGEVGADDPLSAVLPEGVRAPTRDGAEVTLEQLASHTSALPRLPSNLNPAGTDPYAAYTPDLLWAFVGAWRPARAPGSEYEYSNLGAGLLGQLLADKAGTGYEALVRERVCDPLSLDDTRITLDDDHEARLAPGHADGARVSAWNFDALAGCGALRSTSADVLDFALAAMNPPDSAIGRSLNATKAPRFTLPDGQKVGLGWHIALDGATRWHDGGTGGYSSFVAFNRPMDTAVVVIANGSVAQLSAVGTGVMFAMAGMDPDPISFPKVVHVEPDKLERLVGVYNSDMGFVMTVTREEDRLYAQITGQPALRIYPESPTLFKYRAVVAEVEFALDDAGERGTTLTIFQNGMEILCVRDPG